MTHCRPLTFVSAPSAAAAAALFPSCNVSALSLFCLFTLSFPSLVPSVLSFQLVKAETVNFDAVCVNVCVCVCVCVCVIWLRAIAVPLSSVIASRRAPVH